MHVVLHPWRSGPNGDLALVLDAQTPSLHLAKLAGPAEPGDVADGDIVGTFSLYGSPDKRIPDVAATVAKLIVKEWPDWLETRLLQLFNGIGGLVSSGGPRRSTMGLGIVDMSHPLAPLGVWGPNVQTIEREVRLRRLADWDDAQARLPGMLVQAINDAVPEVLQADLLGTRTPRMLLRERL